MALQSSLQLTQKDPAVISNATVASASMFFMADGSSATTPGDLYKKDSAGVVTPVVGVPVGSMVMWPTATPPTGWLVCDGSTFSAVTYPNLNTLLGGNTLPNMKNRFPVGASPGVGTPGASVLGTGGAATATLTNTELPAHTHGPGTLTTGTQSANHTHDAANLVLLTTNAASTTGTLVDNGGSSVASGVVSGRFNHPVSGGGTTTVESATHFHGVNSGATSSQGSGSAFSIIDPYLALNFIIRAG